MSVLLTFIVSSLGIISGKFLFKHWINHLTIYCVIWGGLIILYELKLLPYYNIVSLTWFYIISTFLSFLFGILTVTSIQRLYFHDRLTTQECKLNLKIFLDNGKTVKYAIILFSIISILAAIQHWIALLDIFGSVSAAFLSANIVYKLNTMGGVKGVIPFISTFGFAAVFLSGIYTAYKGRFSFLTFLPFIGIILKSMATVGRVGMLFALIEFFLTFFFIRYLLNKDSEKRFTFAKRNAIFAFAVIFVFFVLSASLVKLLRVTDENMPGTSKVLKQLDDSFIISPSIYLYLSSDIGVLNQYIKSEGEKTKFGENSLIFIHYLLARFDIVEKPRDLQKGYKIPMWVNTGTYIRELHADFGVAGVFLIPYLLGLLITWLWFKFYQKHRIIILVLLIYFTLIIGFSFLMMITRLDIWFVSLFILLLSIPIIEKIAEIRSKHKNNITI